ncbi:hypothetical protein AGMMS49944_30520 [Spirochaetia bacterium]|nr:hypothetical protein AGMMS49944_30520 [Spirochaetia bacterium]
MAHDTLGKVSRDLNQLDTAVDELREAVRLDPANYLYSFDLGRAYFLNRDYPNARKSFEQALSLKGDFEAAWYDLGVPSGL